MILVGSTVAASKFLSDSVPIFLMSFIRYAMGTAVLIVFAYIYKTPWKKVSARNLFVLCIQAFLGGFLFNVLLIFGLKYTASADAGVITGATPAVLALLGIIFLRDRVGMNKWIAIILVSIGVSVINLKSGLSFDKTALFGNFLVFLSVICEAFFLMMRKFLKGDIPDMVVSIVVSFFCTMWFLPMAFYEYVHYGFSWFKGTEALVTVYMGSFVTAAAYILWFAGINRAKVSDAAVVTGVMPLSAVIFSVIFLKESVSFMQGIGCAMVLTGIWFSSGKKVRLKKAHGQFRKPCKNQLS